jgi:16S rRNA (adenine1518-N6/adenine1519-N6)-dimethyltransferase
MSHIEQRTSNLERSSPVPPPLKRLGQHFLIDPNIVRKIIATARIQGDETVLEIGPGRGVLTRHLCGAARRVIAIEIDPKLQDYLSHELADCPNFDLCRGDALAYDYHSLPAGTVVVANLPYYISTPLLVKLLEARASVDRMVVMLQTEVARRLAAKPGADDYGSLSVLAQYAAEVSVDFHVRPGCFQPRPKVGSSVVSLVKRRAPVVYVRDEVMFQRVVRACFAHRRKMIPNSLRDEGWPPEIVGAALTRAGIASTRRAETCTLGEFAALAAALEAKT